MANWKISQLPLTALVTDNDLFEKVDGVSGVSERGTMTQIATKLGFSLPSGRLTLPAGAPATPSLNFTGDTTTGIFRVGASRIGFALAGTLVGEFNNGTFELKSGVPLTWNADVALNREAADTLSLRRSTNAQIFQIYETFTDAANFSRLSIAAAATGHSITSEALGTGTVRKLILNPGTSDIQWGKALVALGGGAAPTFGTIGGTGPATAAQNTWLRLLDSAGVACWVPVWK